MTHFTEAELKRWSESGPGSDRERVTSHVVECFACMNAYSQAIREQKPLATDVSENLTDFVRAGYASRKPKAKLFTIAKWAVPIAAAAAIAIAVSIPRLRETPSSNQISFRGPAVQALSPQGDSASVAEFKWASSVSASKYLVTIGEQSRVILTANSTEPRWSASPQLLATLKPGHAYWWTVAAIDQDGSVIVSSEKLPFTVRQP
jgi:hypothetical protein